MKLYITYALICLSCTAQISISPTPPSMVSYRVGTALPGSCIVGQDVFLNTNLWEIYHCNAANQWEQYVKVLSSSGNPSSTLASSCDQVEEVGRFAKDTTATSAAASIYVCASSGSSVFGWQPIVNAAGSTISGLTAAALVTASSATAIQTPSTSATMDGSGNISTPGSITTGVGGASGFFTFSGSTSGSSTIGAANAAGSPARINLPTATGAASSVLMSDGSTPQQASWNATLGTGSLVRRAAAPVVVTTEVQTGANTTATDLQTTSITGGTLASGKYIRISGHVTTNLTATPELFFGATSICGTHADATEYSFSATVVVTGAATQKATCVISQGSDNAYAHYTTPAETISGAITVKTRGTNGTAVAGQIISRLLLVEYAN